MIEIIGVIFVTLAVVMKFTSYYRQIRKTLRAKKSSQVSSTAFLYKFMEYVCTVVGLSLLCNWWGVSVAVGGMIFCTWALYIIIRYKPKNWKLF